MATGGGSLPGPRWIQTATEMTFPWVKLISTWHPMHKELVYMWGLTPKNAIWACSHSSWHMALGTGRQLCQRGLGVEPWLWLRMHFDCDLSDSWIIWSVSVAHFDFLTSLMFPWIVALVHWYAADFFYLFNECKVDVFLRFTCGLLSISPRGVFWVVRIAYYNTGFVKCMNIFRVHPIICEYGQSSTPFLAITKWIS